MSARRPISARPDISGRAFSSPDGPCDGCVCGAGLQDASSGGARRLERVARYVTAALDRRLVGRVFGGYRIERVLGQGRFGTGYLARAASGDAVFMKLVKRRARCAAAPYPLSRQPGGRGMPFHAPTLDMGAVWAECAALSLCDHPGIPRWLGIVHEDCRYFIVESLMRGRSLASWLAEGRVLSAPEIACIGFSLVDLAAHVNARGVAHNDIRPANVLVSMALDGRRLGRRHERARPARDGVLREGADVSRRGDEEAYSDACDRIGVSLVDFGLAEFFDRSAPASTRMAATSDVSGIAETIVFLLYSNRMNVKASCPPDTPWHDALVLSPAQRNLLLDMFEGRIGSFDRLRIRFDEAFWSR